MMVYTEYRGVGGQLVPYHIPWCGALALPWCSVYHGVLAASYQAPGVLCKSATMVSGRTPCVVRALPCPAARTIWCSWSGSRRAQPRPSHPRQRTHSLHGCRGHVAAQSSARNDARVQGRVPSCDGWRWMARAGARSAMSGWTIIYIIYEK